MKEDIAGFQISVDDALCVGVVQGCCCLFNNRYSFRERDSPSLFYRFAQRAACDIGHNQVSQFILFAVFVNWHDVDMIKSSNGICLAAKARQEFSAYLSIQKETWHQDFYGHSTPWTRLLREKDCSHASTSKQALDSTRSEGVPEKLVVFNDHARPH